jgi:PDDEXK-like domain of unknown function (DUF3799)
VTDTRSIPLRYSVLKHMASSPLHARHALLKSGGEGSLALRIGSGCHALVFGTPEVVVWDGKVRRGKEWDAFEAENEAAGRVILNQTEYAGAQAMADAIKSNEIARRVLFAPDIVREQRIDWTWSGRAWRSTPDARAFRVLAELKTTRCADPQWFWRDALRMHYPAQLAIYRHAIEQTDGVSPRDVYLFAVESSPPYAVVPYQLSERSLEHGWRKAQEWHARWLECEARDEWPGYTTGVEELDVYDRDAEEEMEAERMIAADDGVRADVGF